MQEHCWCAVNLAHTFIKAILKHQLGSIWLIFYQLVHLTWSAFSLFILSKLFHVMVTCLRKAIVSKRESSSFFRSCLHFLKCSIIFLYAMRLQHIQPSKLVLTNYVFWNLYLSFCGMEGDTHSNFYYFILEATIFEQVFDL